MNAAMSKAAKTCSPRGSPVSIDGCCPAMSVLIIVTIIASPYALCEPSSRVAANGSIGGSSPSGGSISSRMGDPSASASHPG